ncbi:MAG: class I SAM-dependent methyltransferase [Candidatus Bathyarchaeota archaeon]|nr:MAG: class I SAM-dependent methyltransferase [Candidatus Bathyarchaeota archaeon]
MADFKDAFGKALTAYQRGEPADHTIERDDGMVEEADTGMYFLPYEKWPEFERKAVLEARGRVLDVGVGAGRVALWLQEGGLEVVGIDVSPLALEVSRLRGVRDCRLMDVGKLDFPVGSFDTVLMLGNNLGIGGEVEQTQRILKDLYRLTSDDGIIIGETRDPLETNKPAHLAYHERNRRRGRSPGLVRIRIGFQGELDDWFELLLVGEEELAELLEPTGWSISKIYCGEGANYVAILEKRPSS